MNLILGATNAIKTIIGRIGQVLALKFDASKVTFTPGMAKRNSAGPFAAGVLVQGAVTNPNQSDEILFQPGTSISGIFYSVIDGFQGSVVLWITPEWNGNDNLEHRILTNTTGISLWKQANNTLYIYIGSPLINVTGPSTAAWVAGTTYCIVLRWDCKNSLDGSNHVCFSVNDVHTFARTSGWTPGNAASGLRLGGYYGNLPANALIEGLTIYRRPLFDGTYGVDAGNGDEINLIYNAGSGADPCSITGSWDVCFCLPTNATAGALTTGSTDAWSHPHASEVLADAFCQTTYADSAWDDVGTPASPVSVAFNGTTTSIDAGSEASVDELHDAAFTAEAWIRPQTTGEGAAGRIFDKANWRLNVGSTGLAGFVDCATTDATTTSALANLPMDNRWHHVVMVFDDAGDRKAWLAVDGIWVGTPVAGVGAVVSDAASNLYIGNNSAGSNTFAGAIGWARISNNARYTPGTNFIPPARTSPPANDANTVRLFAMNEGSGTTITDSSSNAQNGTLSNGTWNTTRDLATDAPGERVYNWGYVSGSDAADEGISQTLLSLQAGADYVLRPVLHYDPNAVPIIRILDATNSDALIASLTCPNQQTNLVVNGGFDSDTTGWTAGASATLSSEAGGVSGNALQVQNGAAAQGYAHQAIQLAPYATYRLTWWHKNGTAQGKVSVGTVAGGTTVYSGSNTNDAAWAQYTMLINSGATGLVYVNLWQGSATNGQNTLFDSITLTRVIDSKRPFCEPFSFELPTVARHGVAADCTSIKVQVLNTAATGTIGVQQVELLPNLIDNPSFEIGSGDPWIPAGWTNGTVNAGGTSQESVIVHSGGGAVKYLGAQSRYLHFGVTTGSYLPSSAFLALGFWSRGVSLGPPSTGSKNGFGRQAGWSGYTVLSQDVAATWTHRSCVIRTGTGPVFKPLASQAFTYNPAYMDDVYLVALDPVSLTVTPASLANSTETTGLRVDGRDTATQQVENCTATSGTLKWRMTPRHSAADVAKFGEATPYILDFYGDANNWLRLYWNAANSITLDIKCAGLTTTQTWNATGAIVAGTTYACELDYNPTTVTFKVDDVAKIMNSTGGFTFGTLPTNVYWGHKQDGSCQFDATFAAPL